MTEFHGGRNIITFSFRRLFQKRMFKAATTDNAQSGLRSTGLFSLNPCVLSDLDFKPSDATSEPGGSISFNTRALQIITLRRAKSTSTEFIPVETVFPQSASYSNKTIQPAYRSRHRATMLTSVTSTEEVGDRYRGEKRKGCPEDERCP